MCLYDSIYPFVPKWDNPGMWRIINMYPDNATDIEFNFCRKLPLKRKVANRPTQINNLETR